MKLDKKTTLQEIYDLVGKKGRYRTARGGSMLNTIVQVEITQNDVVLLLQESSGRLRRRKLSHFTIVEEKPAKEIVEKVERPKKLPKDVAESLVDLLKLPVIPEE